jgi:amidase/aspartyl-tRNA(Asn)/glutamyl-tRNA(Gln) amidotransferase subunit A
MTPDLTALAADITLGRSRAQDALAVSMAIAGQPINRHAFVRRFDDEAAQQAHAADEAARAARALPLSGLAVSVKDLFDVAGHPTTAAAKVLAGAAPAAADAPAVARLRAAGAALVGHTNMTEFAFSGVGINPHHGTPPNAATATLDGTPRIPGGSTSGGAVSVATGAAWAALGSDTGGSIRIPAALQGLVGFKNTQRLTPLEGAIPLAPSLDTTCAITRSVRDAVLLHEVLANRRVVLAGKPLASLRLAVPTRLMLDGLEDAVARAFERSLQALRRGGATVLERPFDALQRLPELQAGGGLSAAESWAWHRHRMAAQEAEYDPRVAARIRRGSTLSAADYIDLLHARAAFIAEMDSALRDVDAVLCPTVPIVAPPIASLVGDDERFFATNALLLRNPLVVNLLDGCAVSLPMQAPGEWPSGLMVWSGALRDDAVLDVAQAIEDCLHRCAS